MKLLSDAFDDSIADFHLAYYVKLPHTFLATVSQGDGTDTSTLTSAFSSSRTVATSQEGIANFDSNIFSPVRRVRRVELFPLITTIYEADLGVFIRGETAN